MTNDKSSSASGQGFVIFHFGKKGNDPSGPFSLIKRFVPAPLTRLAGASHPLPSGEGEPSGPFLFLTRTTCVYPSAKPRRPHGVQTFVAAISSNRFFSAGPRRGRT